jgi:hypothetical protein
MQRDAERGPVEGERDVGGMPGQAYGGVEVRHGRGPRRERQPGIDGGGQLPFGAGVADRDPQSARRGDAGADRHGRREREHAVPGATRADKSAEVVDQRSGLVGGQAGARRPADGMAEVSSRVGEDPERHDRDGLIAGTGQQPQAGEHRIEFRALRGRKQVGAHGGDEGAQGRAASRGERRLRDAR